VPQHGQRHNSWHGMFMTFCSAWHDARRSLEHDVFLVFSTAWHVHGIFQCMAGTWRFPVHGMMQGAFQSMMCSWCFLLHGMFRHFPVHVPRPVMA
jgi:hypothetical protein